MRHTRATRAGLRAVVRRGTVVDERDAVGRDERARVDPERVDPEREDPERDEPEREVVDRDATVVRF